MFKIHISAIYYFCLNFTNFQKLLKFSTHEVTSINRRCSVTKIKILKQAAVANSIVLLLDCWMFTSETNLSDTTEPQNYSVLSA